MKRSHESYLNPASLISTLYGMGIRGVVPVGALAWQTYPAAAAAPVVVPGALSGEDGPAIGFIAPNLLTLPYWATHWNYTFRERPNNNVERWKLQDSLGVTRRAIRFQNPAKDTGGLTMGESPVVTLPPIPLTPDLGIRAVLAVDSVAGLPDQGARAYLTALLVRPLIVPALLAVAPTALGAVLPTTAAGTTLTSSATSWAFGSYVQLTAGLATGALITSVSINSGSETDGQAAFATGAGGSEIDWGIFGWAEPAGTYLTAARYNLNPFPLYLPASTRLAARCRGTAGSDTFNVGIEYIPIPIR